MKFGLNEQQKKAVEHLDGPCLVTSCPGSGKTFTLVERIVRLIEKGVRPQNILCITFTNKAAAEMKERICKRLGVAKPGFFIGTFHSLCANILRKLGPLNGLPSNFTIIDDKEQFEVCKQIARKMGIEIENKNDIYKILNLLNHYRDQLEDFSYVEERLTHDYEVKIARTFLQKCKDSRLVDFSGLIYDSIKLIEECEEVREKLQNGFKYILVDETQDTNGSQYHLVNLLGAKWNNVMLIGDLDQCVIEGEKILTRDGYRKVEDVKIGDIVKSGRGGGEIVDSKILNIYKKSVDNYNVITIKTKTGRICTFSKEHIVFAGFTKESPKKIVVYLMYDKKLGYRVGVTNTYRKYTVDSIGGIGCRLNQERATCMWILKVFDDIKDAKFWEQYISVKYGIPTWCFHTDKYRKLDYDNDAISKLFHKIDTRYNADILMRDLLIDINRPHHQPKCMNKSRRRNFTINMCADSRGSTMHRYSISGSCDQDASRLSNAGLNVRDNGKKAKGWRVESAHKNVGDIYSILDKVKKEFNSDVNIIEKIKLNDTTLGFMPASHIREGMQVYIEDEGNVILDEVISVEFCDYTGNLYDIDVERYHNFITNGVFSHNSIYMFRGAKYKNLENFIEMHDDCTVIPLSKNYRSTPEIIGTADKLIKHNSSHMGGKFETDNPSGEPVRCFQKRNQIDEANWVAGQIERLKSEGGWDGDDIAVLYRMNKMSEPIEQALTLKGIPYEVVGGFGFYDRKEVKDIIAMIKFLINDRDGIAFHRICSILPGMGDVTVGKIENRAEENSISILEAVTDIHEGSKSINLKTACNKLIESFGRDYSHSEPAKSVLNLIADFDYLAYLDKYYPKNAAERKENVSQIVQAASRYNGHPDGIEMYLQQISLVSASDKEIQDKKVSLMSLHAAKGLEFPIVFMIGVEHGILPHGRAISENPEEGLEEERRLAYVGMTRAKKVLYITYCARRFGYGKFGNQNQRNAYPSKFLKEAALVDGTRDRTKIHC